MAIDCTRLQITLENQEERRGPLFRTVQRRNTDIPPSPFNFDFQYFQSFYAKIALVAEDLQISLLDFNICNDEQYSFKYPLTLAYVVRNFPLTSLARCPDWRLDTLFQNDFHFQSSCILEKNFCSTKQQSLIQINAIVPSLVCLLSFGLDHVLSQYLFRFINGSKSCSEYYTVSDPSI